MLRSDFRVIFTALGFMAMAQKDGLSSIDRKARAIALARLIESFCYITVPEAFENDEINMDPDMQDTAYAQSVF